MLPRASSLILSAAIISYAPVVVAAPPAPEIRPDTVPKDDVGAAPGPAKTEHRNRNLRISGLTLLGSGVVLAGVGFSGFASVHATNPGSGLSIEGENPQQAREVFRTVRIMSSLGYAGLGLIVAGSVLLGVGDTERRAARRAHRAQRRRLAVVPGPGTVLVVGRF